jgi:hypothetical protein
MILWAWPAVTAGVLAAVLCSPSAMAGGSVSLREVLKSAKSAKLNEEVNAALKNSKTAKAGEEPVCSATRIGRHFGSLGGERIAPYTCEIDGRFLDIDAKVSLQDAEGRDLDVEAPDTPGKAAKVTQDEFTWRWRDAP